MTKLSEKVFYREIDVGIVSTTNPRMASPLDCNELVELILEQTPQTSNSVGFSHYTQTDLIRVTRGFLVVAILFDRQLHYFPLKSDENKVLIIKPRTWHSLLNPVSEPCFLYNAAQRHLPKHPNDYKSIRVNLVYDWTKVHQSLQTLV